MKRNALLLLIVFIVLPTSLFSNTLYFPQVAFGGGYSTTFVITNTGSAPVASSVNFYGQTGVGRPDLNVPVNLAAGNSVRFTIPNTGALTSVVWGELVAGAGTVKGVASFDLRNPAGTLITSAGVLGIEGGNSFLLPVDITANGSTSTGVAIANVSAVPVAVRLRLIREDGTEMATSTAAIFNPLAAHGQTADFLPQWFPQLAGVAFRGTLVVDAPGAALSALSATALTVKEGLLAALPVIPSGSAGTPGSTLYFPQVAFGGGYSTNFVIMNTGQSNISSTVNFYDQNGVNRSDLSRPANVPAGGSARFTLPNTGATTTVVWGELQPGAGTIQGVASFDLRAPNNTLSTTAGVLGLQSGNSYNFPVDITANGFSSTGVAIANVTNNPVNVTLRLLGEGATQTGTSTHASFNPLGGRRQIADFVPQWFPQLAGTGFKGTLVVEAAAGTPANALSATALTVKEGLLSALPVNAGSIAASSGGGGGGGGGVGTGGPASACLDPSLYNNANTLHLEYLVSGSFGGTSVSDFVHSPNSSFEGNAASEWSGTTTTNYAGQPTTLTRTKSYLRVEGQEILMFGNTGEFATPLVGTFKVVFTPPYRNRRYTLGLGESVTHNFTSVSTTTFQGLPSLPPATSTGTETIRYLGRETVTVAAGTFETCKFETDGVTTTWEIVGKGLAAKTLSSNSGTAVTLELTAGSINGAAVR